MSKLIEKALSTSSEEEAINCLRMARKRKEKIGQSDVQKTDLDPYLKHINMIEHELRRKSSLVDHYKNQRDLYQDRYEETIKVYAANTIETHKKVSMRTASTFIVTSILWIVVIVLTL